MIKRLIFDVDGTLITGVTFNVAIEKTLKKLGIYSQDNVTKFFDAIKSYEEKYNNYNDIDYINHIARTINIKLGKKFLEVFFEELKYIVPSRNEKLIERISQLSKHYELVLLTNYFRKSQLNRLNEMGIGHFFIECYGQDLIKPNIDAYISACGKHDANECVMIGDDLFLDIEQAQKVGLKTIFVNSKNIDNIHIKTIEVKKIEQITSNLIETM